MNDDALRLAAFAKSSTPGFGGALCAPSARVDGNTSTVEMEIIDVLPQNTISEKDVSAKGAVGVHASSISRRREASPTGNG